MKKWKEKELKDKNVVYILKEKPFSYRFIKVNKSSQKVSHGIVDLNSYLINPILIELNYKKKLEDSIEYVLLAFEQHGFSRYIKGEKKFFDKDFLDYHVQYLKM